MVWKIMAFGGAFIVIVSMIILAILPQNEVKDPSKVPTISITPTP